LKHLAWIPVAFLFGLLIGSWAPRGDLRKARRALVEARRATGGERSGSGQFESVSRFLRIPQGREAPAGQAGPPSGSAPVPPVGADPGVEVEDGSAGEDPAAEDRDQLLDRFGRDDLQSRIDQATELWQMRADMARAAFVANTELDEAQAAQFDVLVASMNMRLRERLEAWAGELREADQAGPETGMRMINELTDTMVLTYDELDRTMPQDWRDRSGGSVDLTDFIDPSVATPLIGVESRLQRRAGRER
jgi:hypothetical protein